MPGVGAPTLHTKAANTRNIVFAMVLELTEINKSKLQAIAFAP